MSPGPISDSYDPEFGTGNNADDLAEAIGQMSDRFGKLLGPRLKNIIEVVHGEVGREWKIGLCEKELRILRFCLNRAKESI